MRAASAAFLSRTGLAAGSACLDVGCGDGLVTIELARAVGPRGRVVGIDIDAGALSIAREATDRAGVQVQFLRAEATAPPERDAFDLAYARLVLSHLADPIGALRAMRAAVREDTVSNAMTTIEQKLFLVGLLENMREAMLDARVTTAAELDEVRRNVDRAARVAESVFHQARIHQVWGRRAS
jgi:2-polyprenyl-3-methyl-5-hydroxy-6-metoxy-1,4-benzoquinol methylase